MLDRLRDFSSCTPIDGILYIGRAMFHQKRGDAIYWSIALLDVSNILILCDICLRK